MSNQNKNLIAPCGIDCQVCDAYIATQTDNSAMREKMAQNYKEQYNKDIDPETLYCDGCVSDGRHIGFCNVCQIRSCAFAREYQTCAECTDFPCEKGSFIWTENSKSKATLEALRNS